MTATCLRLEEWEEGRVTNVRRYCRPQPPLFPLVLCWLLWHGSSFGNMWFLFLLLKKKEYIFQQHCDKKLSLPSLHNICMHMVVWECLFHEDLFRNDKGSLSLTQAMCVCSETLVLPTSENFTTKYPRGCPSTDWWIFVTFCCFCHQCHRCDNSGSSILAEESLSLEISLQGSYVSSTEK